MAITGRSVFQIILVVVLGCIISQEFEYFDDDRTFIVFAAKIDVIADNLEIFVAFVIDSGAVL